MRPGTDDTIPSQLFYGLRTVNYSQLQHLRALTSCNLQYHYSLSSLHNASSRSFAYSSFTSTRQFLFFTSLGFPWHCASGKRFLQAHKHTETLHSATFSPQRQDTCACHSATSPVISSGQPPPFLSKRLHVDRLPAGRYRGDLTITITSLAQLFWRDIQRRQLLLYLFLETPSLFHSHDTRRPESRKDDTTPPNCPTQPTTKKHDLVIF